MRAIMAAVLICFMVVPFGLAEPELKGAPAELAAYLADVPQLVTLTGQAELQVKADRVIFTMSISSEDQSLEKALKANGVLRAKIVKALQGKGLAAAKISSLKLPAIPLYRPASGDQARRFKVADIIRVQGETETEYAAVASFLDTSSDVEYDGIQFEIINENEHKRKALDMACEELTMKQQVYTDKLGVQLRLKRIAEHITFSTGEKIEVEGSTHGIKTNLQMGLFVVKARVEASYVIERN